MRYVLEWFYELDGERDYTDMGQEKALNSEKLESWSRLNGVRLVAYELEALRRLDRLFRSKQFDDTKEE